MAEPTITSSIEVLPENFWDRHFPEAKWENRSNEKIVNRWANSHQEELKESLKNYPISPNTTEIFCKYHVLYIRTKDSKYDDTIIKNLSAKTLSSQNLEKYSALLELMGKLETITEKYGFPARAIVSMDDVIDALYTNGDKKVITEEIKKEIDAYYEQYGARK